MKLYLKSYLTIAILLISFTNLTAMSILHGNKELNEPCNWKRVGSQCKKNMECSWSNFGKLVCKMKYGKKCEKNSWCARDHICSNNICYVISKYYPTTQCQMGIADDNLKCNKVTHYEPDLNESEEWDVMNLAFPMCMKIGRDATGALLKAYWDGVDIPEVKEHFELTPLRNKFKWKIIERFLEAKLGLNLKYEDFSKYISKTGDLYKENMEFMERLQKTANFGRMDARLKALGISLKKKKNFIESSSSRLKGLGQISKAARTTMIVAINHSTVNGIINRYQEFMTNSPEVIDTHQCSGNHNNKLEDWTR